MALSIDNTKNGTNEALFKANRAVIYQIRNDFFIQLVEKYIKSEKTDEDKAFVSKIQILKLEEILQHVDTGIAFIEFDWREKMDPGIFTTHMAQPYTYAMVENFQEIFKTYQWEEITKTFISKMYMAAHSDGRRKWEKTIVPVKKIRKDHFDVVTSRGIKKILLFDDKNVYHKAFALQYMKEYSDLI